MLSRGNNRAPIYKNEKDYLDFFDLFEEMRDRFSVTIYAYVLIGKHFHLLLQTRNNNLSKAMQWLGSSYTRQFNLRHKQGGHLFQGRFKSILVENDAYFINLSCYIHRNPLRAKMVKRLSDYKYSSYPHYAYGIEPPGWLNTGSILAYFGRTHDRHQKYRKKIQSYSGEAHSIWEEVKFGFIYGSQSFIDYIKEQILSGKPDKELPKLNQFLRSQDPNSIIKRAENIPGCKVADLKKARRLREKIVIKGM